MTKKLQQPATSPESWKPTPVELELGYDPVFQTPRFDVFLTMVVRNPGLGFGRDVYMAWFRDEDVPRSVCEVTLFGNFVEWLHVCEQHRRQGIATEVMGASFRKNKSVIPHLSTAIYSAFLFALAAVT